MRVPATPLTAEFGAEGHLCADFAQIYFPAQNPVLGKAYQSATTLDPWLRESKYPPVVHYVASKTVDGLPYGPASIIHLAVQYVLFLASVWYACVRLGIRRKFLSLSVVINVCLFLTPVGLSWLERGQFSLYVGLCYLWLMLALVTGKKWPVCLSALFGFIKWTSFPFVAVSSVINLMLGRDVDDLKQRLWTFALFGAAVVLLFIVFYPEGISFLQAIKAQELAYQPLGITLARVLPTSVVKMVPLLLVSVGLLERLSVRRDFAYMIPFLTGAAILLTTFPTYAFDYSVPCLTAFLPFITYWSTLPGISGTSGTIVRCLFLAFLLVASFSIKLLFGSETFVLGTYVFVSICLAVVPFLGDMSRHRDSAPSCS